MRANKRVSDPAARFGGDEFAIVLAGADLAEATAIAQRIHDDGETTDVLLQAADAARYHAKREGGNRVLAARGV